MEDNPTLRKSKGLHSLVSVSGSEEPADFSSEPKNNCCENHSDTSCKNTPEDWKPVDKCCFCAQENLLKLESELVTQIDPTDKVINRILLIEQHFKHFLLTPISDLRQ